MFESPPLLSSLRAPVYFLSIGGPSSLENKHHPSYAQLEAIGYDITTKIKPKAVVVFSAHWQDNSPKIKVNAAAQTEIMYDFHGFPSHFYEYKFPYKGSPEVATKVVEKLTSVGLGVERVSRGLDHGIWAGFLIAFDPKKNPLEVPIVQVSLHGSQDCSQHYQTGQALESLRDEGILIIGAGMAVHNLQDYQASRRTHGITQYATDFDEALKAAATANPEQRWEKLSALMRRSDARRAHPTLEHIFPMYVAAGAAGVDNCEQAWTLPEGSLSWAYYRYGEIREE